MNVNYLNPNV